LKLLHVQWCATEDMNKGLMMNTHLSPLACVWASLQVLIGDVASGLRSVLYWYLGIPRQIMADSETNP
jgi:O-glycosyl hydrolase